MALQHYPGKSYLGCRPCFGLACWIACAGSNMNSGFGFRGEALVPSPGADPATLHSGSTCCHEAGLRQNEAGLWSGRPDVSDSMVLWLKNMSGVHENAVCVASCIRCQAMHTARN